MINKHTTFEGLISSMKTTVTSLTTWAPGSSNPGDVTQGRSC
jgi:hypothetical protein